jgi:YceI-like domain
MKSPLKISALLIALTISGTASAQSLYSTKTGQISFFSETPIRNIEAVSNEVVSMINSGTGEIGFVVLVKSFRFEKSLMEEHFNENYMETPKFPKATFQGKITNLKAIDFKKDGTYIVSVEGKLTMHGVSKSISTVGKITVEKGKIIAVASFIAKLEDYDVKRPTIVAAEIAENVEIKINCRYESKSNEAKP